MSHTPTHSDKSPEIHISEAEALRLDFPTVLALVRKGARIVIEGNTVVVISSEAEAVVSKSAPPVARIAPTTPRGRTISESIALAKKCEEAMAESPVMTADFARDVEEVIRNRKPWNPPAWE